MDLEDEGNDAEGYANRAGQIMSGLTHAVLGVSALTILWKGHASDDGNSAANWSGCWSLRRVRRRSASASIYS